MLDIDHLKFSFTLTGNKASPDMSFYQYVRDRYSEYLDPTIEMREKITCLAGASLQDLSLWNCVGIGKMLSSAGSAPRIRCDEIRNTKKVSRIVNSSRLQNESFVALV